MINEKFTKQANGDTPMNAVWIIQNRLEDGFCFIDIFCFRAVRRLGYSPRVSVGHDRVCQ